MHGLNTKTISEPKCFQLPNIRKIVYCEMALHAETAATIRRSNSENVTVHYCMHSACLENAATFAINTLY